EVRKFLDKHFENSSPGSDEFLARHDQLVAAEQALSAVVRFHESARETGGREGDAWDDVGKGLRKQLLDVQLQQLRGRPAAGTGTRPSPVPRRLAEPSPGVAEQAQTAGLLPELLRGALKDQPYSADKMKEARQRLRALADRFPDSEVSKPITQSLQA